ncbi:signal-induced proliferation-associated 1-like protein 2 isoform X1 [Branchiostoma lanceolatum]|uniref:signal-induced proliferation-associated 1-like protein 2 isoform X1 n=1 Tax=Branchiostoma lanceolatum TaxID=7740 RepID=UPI003453667F
MTSHTKRESPHGDSRENLGVDLLDTTSARLRAQQAAEYYHKSLLQNGSSPHSTPPAREISGQKSPRGDSPKVNGSDSTESSPGNASTRHAVKIHLNLSRTSPPKANMNNNTSYADERMSPRARLGPHPRASMHAVIAENRSYRKPKSKVDPYKGMDLARERGGHALLRSKRSNSDLSLNEVTDDYLDGSLRREYGSTSSLEVQSVGGESFFAMLKDLRPDMSFDQRSPAPPKIQDYLRCRADGTLVEASGRVVNGGAEEPRPQNSSSSPKLSRAMTPRAKEKQIKYSRSKSAGGESSLFSMLLGTKKDGPDTMKSPDAEVDGRLDDKLRRRAFSHYDCQSMTFNLSDVVRNKEYLERRRNTTTGASAASSIRTSHASSPHNSTEDLSIQELDLGDGKSNNLVLSCPFFRNELGGEEERRICLSRGNGGSRASRAFREGMGPNLDSMSGLRPTTASVSVLDTGPDQDDMWPVGGRTRGYAIEHVDHGAYYFRRYFHGQSDVQNYLGVDENLGPIAISVRREKLPDHSGSSNKDGGSPVPAQYMYRLIIRTSDLVTLRGSILEDAIPSTARHGTSRGLPIKDVLEFVAPEVNLGCLRLASLSPKTSEQLMRLDEQGISTQYKVGVLYCKTDQGTEEEMYNNESAGPIFDEFLDTLGERVRLKGFEKYRAQLDNKTDSTGSHSLYATYKNCEVMFHVSTMLPYTPNNRQQLLRKRHIGNDIVTIVFQEPGALPFTPKTIRSHFQHVFIVVQAINPNTDNVMYQVTVARSKDVPPFGPSMPEGATFPKSPQFKEFLLAKIINAENAAHKSEKFAAMAVRTRQEYLKDLAANSTTTTSIDSALKFGKFSLSGKKKEKTRPRLAPELASTGAIIWDIQIDDFSTSTTVDCILGVSSEMFVLVDREVKEALFSTPCKSVIGWTSQTDGLKVYYNRGECVVMSCPDSEAEVTEIVERLMRVTQGCETLEMTLRRNSLGQLGFHVDLEGMVAEVEPYGFAWQAGLRQGSRLVEICKVAVATLSHDQMIDLLRTSVTVKVVIIPPMDDGTPRRGLSDQYSNYSTLESSVSSHSSQERSDDDSVSGASRTLTSSRNSSLRSNQSAAIQTTQPQRSSSASPSARQGSPAQFRYRHEYGHGRDAGGELRRQVLEGMSGREGRYSRDSPSSTLPLLVGQDEPSLMEERHRAENVDTTVDAADLAWAYKPEMYMESGSSNINYQQNRAHRQNNMHTPNSSDSSKNNTLSSTDTSTSDEKWYDTGDNMEPEFPSTQRTASTDSGLDGAMIPMTNLIKAGDREGSTQHVGESPENFHTPPENTVDVPDFMQHPRYRSSITRAMEKMRGHDPDGPRAGPQDPSNSTSNLSEVSSHSQSSDGSLGSGHRDRLNMGTRDGNPSPNKSQGSPTQRRKKAGPKKYTLDDSASSASSSSPKASLRSLVMDDGGGTRSRPGSIATRGNSRTAALLQAASMQEDLLKLINPDVSEAEIQAANSRDGASGPGRPPIPRTVSDESMNGSRLNMNRSSSHDSLDRAGRGDSTFNSAVPLLRTYPSRMSAHSAHVREGGRDKSYPGNMLPLPDPAAGINWNNLVETAKQFEAHWGKEQDLSSLSDLSVQGIGPSPVANRPAPETEARSSGEANEERSGGTNSENKLQPSARMSAGQQLRRDPEESQRGRRPQSALQRSTELETRVRQLQEELRKERQEKAALQAENEQLRQDNVRLQEESQTAAAQLRKFTEWFFNTIDRQ